MKPIVWVGILLIVFPPILSGLALAGGIALIVFAAKKTSWFEVAKCAA